MRAIRLPILLALAGLPVLAARGDALPAPAPREPVLAVMDILNNTGEFAAFVEGMPDMLITELMETGDVKLVERTKVQTAMKALKLETSGLTEERNLELGKWLGVDGILFGTFNRAGDKYRLDVRAIDVQTGKIKVAASATCGKQNVLDIIPQIGVQLRNRLVDASLGRAGAASRPALPAAASPAVDSCPLEIRYKMTVGVFSEASIPFQRVRIYLDNRLLGVSGVVDGLNRYFLLFQGGIPAGGHTLTLVHGSVDRQGRWLRELENQPETFSFHVHKGDRPAIQYRMQAYDRRNAFSDFSLNLYQPHDGE